jgi:protoheme IX farnesyltransferase
MQAQTQTSVGAYGSERTPARWRTVLSVFKLRIGVIIALTAMAGIAVQPGVELSAAQVTAVFIAVLLASASAGAFNQYYEADLDQRMRRTRARPFAAGRLQKHGGWLALIVVLAALAVALAWTATNAATALFTFLGAFFYAVVYTVWLKRRTWWNIVIGGLAGSFGVLAGAAAVAPGLSPQAVALAVILFLWTPPHFWSLAIVCRDDYVATGVPMLPAVKGVTVTAQAIFAHVVALVGLSLLLPMWGAGPVYLVCAAAGGAWFVARAWQLLSAPSANTARLAFRASLVQLSVLLLGAMLDAAIRF